MKFKISNGKTMVRDGADVSVYDGDKRFISHVKYPTVREAKQAMKIF